MGLINDIIGAAQGNRAGNAIANANIAAEHGVLAATKSGQENLGNAGGTANATLTDFLAKQQANAAPYVEGGAAGEDALKKYALSNPQFDPTKAADFYNTPAYKFQMEQGTSALQNRASALGVGSSGATLKALTDYGQGLASTYYQQAFNNAQNTFQTNQNATLSNLSALTGTGEFGAGLSNQAYGNTGAQMSHNDLTVAELQAKLGLAGSESAGNFAVGAGRGTAAGIMNQQNAWGNLGSDVLSMAAGAPWLSVPGVGGTLSDIAGAMEGGH